MIDVGDFGPDLALPDQHGRSRALYSQDIAGTNNVLFFIEEALPSALASSIELIKADFDLSAGRPVMVTPMAPEATLPVAETAAIDFPVLSDPGGAMMTAIAGGKPSKPYAAAVFDRNGRLMAAGIDDDLAGLVMRATEICRNQVPGYEPGLLVTQAPVLLIPRILEQQECDYLIEFWKDGEKRRNEISSGTLGQSLAARSAEVKRRADVLVPQDDNPANKLIQMRVARRVVPEMYKAFNFDARAYDIGRIGCYDSSDSGFFRPHRDILSDDAENPRKFALSLNLNDDYSGGALRFPEYGERTYSPAKGAGVVFSCSLLHEALPVETGQRFGLFLFFN